MSKTEVSGKQVKDGSIELVDLSTGLANTISGKADSASLAAVATSGSYNDLADKPSIPSVSGLASQSYVDSAVANKADSASLAAVATSGSYNDLTNKPSLFSGSYTDLSNKPSLFDGAYSSLTGAPSLATVATSGSYNDLTGKPTLFSGAYNDLTGKPSLFDGAYSSLTGAPSLATVATSGSYNDLSNKPSLFSGSYNDLSNKPTIPSTIDDLSDVTITSPSADQILKYNGSGWVNSAAPSSFSGSYNDLTNKPTLGSFTTLTSPTSGQFLKYNGSAWVNSAVAYSDVTGTPTLATVATTGAYSDLSGKPTVPATLDDLTDVVVSSAAKGQFIVHNGTNFVNARTIEANAAATVPLTVKGASSQSANLLELQNSSGTVMTSMDVSGGIAAVSASFITTANDAFPLYVRRPATPTRPGFAVFDSGWNRLFAVGYDGRYVGAPAGLGGFVEIGSSIYNFTMLGYHTDTSALRVISRADTAQSWESPSGAAGTYYLTLARDTTAGVTSWKFTPSGFATNINFATKVGVNCSAAPAAQFEIDSSAAATKGMIVKGAASQSANLFEAQKSDATVLVSIDSAGTLHATKSTQTNAGAFSTTRSPASGTLTIDTSLGGTYLGALDASVTTWAFTNVPSDNSKVTTITAVIAGNASYTYGDACSVNGSAITNGVMWSGGSAPTATSGTDIITFVIVKDSAGTVKVFGSATTNFS